MLRQRKIPEKHFSPRSNLIVTFIKTIGRCASERRKERPWMGEQRRATKCPRAPHTDRIERGRAPPASFPTRKSARGVPRKRSLRSAKSRRRFWRRQRRNRGEGGDRGGEGMVVTRTGHCHPRGHRRHDLPSLPMQNHPLSRSMGNYFLSVDYGGGGVGMNFRTTRRPDYFGRDTGSLRGPRYRRERERSRRR